MLDWIQESFHSLVIEWGPALLEGAGVTLQISLGAFALGLTIGLAVAMIKLKAPPALRAVANAYTSICRSVPELLLILLLYYLGEDLINTTLTLLGQETVEVNGFIAGMVVLGIVQGAYAAEIIRGAVLAVPYGQLEAARAYGCGPIHILRRILLPAMLPFALAGLANLWLVLIKDSALISVIGSSELFFTAKQAAGSTRQYLLFYVAVGGIYLMMTLLSNLCFASFERKFQRWMPIAN